MPERETWINGHINCSASGNPAPVVTLVVQNGEPIIAENTASFTVTDELRGSVEVRCSAENDVNGSKTQMESTHDMTILGK